MSRKICCVALSLLILISFEFTAKAQDGGLKSVFHRGIGARQLALGGAVVAYPQDPSTIFWNPAGMEYLSEKSVSFFHTNFLEGTSYNFFGFVYPTLYIGTFGVGITRIATGGTIRRDFGFKPLGEIGYDQSEIYVSYAKIVRNLVSVGATVKMERQSIGNLGDVGVGVDLSLMYLPDLGVEYLENLRLGLNIQNALSPRLNPGDETDLIPTRFLLGAARPFYLGLDRNPLVFMLTFDSGQRQSMALHAGVEYSYQNKGMIRLGLDESGVAFGAGTTFRQFQLDYSYGQLAEGSFGGSHRFSMTIRFGKTREESLDIAEQKQRMEIEEQVAQEQIRERTRTISRLLDEGRILYRSGEYFDASLKYLQVLDLDSLNLEADELNDESQKRLREIRLQEFDDAVARNQQQRAIQETRDFVNNSVEQGQKYLAAGDFNSAIRQFQNALVRQPDRQSIKDMIEKTKEELNNKINGYIDQADSFAKKARYQEAIRVLGEAQLLIERDNVRFGEIMGKIAGLEKKVNVYDFYQRGLIEYRAENWAGALDFFKKAKNIDPNYSDLDAFYMEDERRANAKEEVMTPEMEKRFGRGYELYIDGRIQDAIDIWEELLQIQPYNKEIIDLIDKARKQLDKQKKINR